jgi:spore germination protein GerM
MSLASFTSSEYARPLRGVKYVMSTSTKRLVVLLAVMLVLYFVLTSSTVYTACTRALESIKQLLGLKPKPEPAPDQPGTTEPGIPTTIVYKPAEDTRPTGTTRMTLYFADADIMFLVPVTRTVSLTPSPIRETLNELFRGPATGSGLIAPFTSDLTLRDLALRADGTLRVDLPQQVVQASAGWGSSMSVSTLESILRTVGEYSAVKAVQFLVGGKVVETLFHGLEAAQPMEAPKSTSGPGHLTVYYVLFAGSRAYLIPDQVQVAGTGTASLIKQAVEQLKVGKTVGDYHLYPTLPSNVTVLGVDLSGKTAYLNLSSEFGDVLALDPARQSLLIDSLVYTVTSFPEVEQVQILVEGKTVQQTMGHRNIGAPLKRPPWINPE